MADIQITSNEENLYVPIIMEGREVGKTLKKNESFLVTDVVWDRQVIARQQARDGKVTATSV